MNKKQEILPDDSSLEKEYPLLHFISKENPFSVPQNYFDSLPSEIVGKCRRDEQPKSWSEGIITALLGYKYRLLAVMGCLALIGFFLVRPNDRPVSYEVLAQNIPDSLIVQHLDNNIASISESALEDLQVPEENLSYTKSNSDSTGTDQDIVTYLIEHNINVSDIENEP